MYTSPASGTLSSATSSSFDSLPMKRGGQVDQHMPSLEWPHGLLAARRRAGIGALRLSVELVLFEHLAVPLHARDLLRAGGKGRTDPVGNSYRLIAKIEYRLQIAFVREVLTHANYDKDRWK